MWWWMHWTYNQKQYTSEKTAYIQFVQDSVVFHYMVQKTTAEAKECRLKQGNMYMLEDIALELVDDLNFHISF